MATLNPRFVERLLESKNRNVLLCGCGGGFDFVHSMLLYPALKEQGKNITIGSYSFNRPETIGGPAQTIFAQDSVIAKRVTAQSIPNAVYCPEVHTCSFLDAAYPEDGPHSIYAYYARDFTVPLLRKLYQQIADHHHIDCIVLVDGGSDSLVVGDENGLGDPVEDAVSVAAVNSLRNVSERILICVGLGSDRYNHVSDGTSLRAIAELTRTEGYLGCLGLEPKNIGYRFYRRLIEHIYSRQTFQSVVAGMIIASVEGYYGSQDIPPMLSRRLRAGDAFYLWPLMSCLWAFEVSTVAERSLIAKWISEKSTVADCYRAISKGRKAIRGALRGVEDLPRQRDMGAELAMDFTEMYVRQHSRDDSELKDLEAT